MQQQRRPKLNKFRTSRAKQRASRKDQDDQVAQQSHPHDMQATATLGSLSEYVTDGINVGPVCKCVRLWPDIVYLNGSIGQCPVCAHGPEDARHLLFGCERAVKNMTLTWSYSEDESVDDDGSSL